MNQVTVEMKITNDKLRILMPGGGLNHYERDYDDPERGATYNTPTQNQYGTVVLGGYTDTNPNFVVVPAEKAGKMMQTAQEVVREVEALNSTFISPHWLVRIDNGVYYNTPTFVIGGSSKIVSPRCDGVIDKNLRGSLTAIANKHGLMLVIEHVNYHDDRDYVRIHFVQDYKEVVNE